MSTGYLLDTQTNSSEKNLEVFTLVWLDASGSSVADEKTEKQLRSQINYLKIFDNKTRCEQYIIQRSKNDRLVLVVSGSLGRELVPQIHQLQQVSAIYVYCFDKEANEKWACKHSKIRDVIVSKKEFLSKIEHDHQLRMKIEQPLLFNIFPKDTSDTNTIHQLAYFQLLIQSLIYMEFSSTDHNELISLLEKNYQGNENQLRVIREIQSDYSTDKVLSWYTTYPFLESILNKALETQNIQLIFLFHSFISSLYSQLQVRQWKSSVQVFRSYLLPGDEVENLKDKVGRTICINSFLLANLDRSKALDYLKLYRKDSSDLQSVLFEINADPTSTTMKPFASITSEDPSELLFTTSSIFLINEITYSDADQLWIIKITLGNDAQYNALLKLAQVQQDSPSKLTDLRTFAKILWKMKKFDLAEYYYNRWINELPANDPILISLYDDLGSMTIEQGNYENSLRYLTKALEIKKQNPSFTGTFMDGATVLDYFPDIACQIHRPTCSQHDSCDQLYDEVHMRIFFHRLPCPSGSNCDQIDVAEHCKTYSHPGFCIEKGSCKDTSAPHLLRYRHVPLCQAGLKCSLLIKPDSVHCTKFRHCKTSCDLGTYCFDYYDNEHVEEKSHPFNTPCPYTPFACTLHQRSVDSLDESDRALIEAHCSRYSHICSFGRTCLQRSDKNHIQSTIHIVRQTCPEQENCSLIHDDNHLDSFSHDHIRDIRRLCPAGKSNCSARSNFVHIEQFRHNAHFDHFGVSRYLALNRNIDFVANQKEMIENIRTYLQTAKWTDTSLTIPDELKRWIRALQPIHRCNKLIFESILIHGHVMSRDHMNSLKYSDSVEEAVKHHTKIKHIFDRIENPHVQQIYREYLQLLIRIQFSRAGKTVGNSSASSVPSPEEHQSLLSKLEKIKVDIDRLLNKYVTHDDLKILQTLTAEIATASLQLHANPTGIGFAPDESLGTNKHVFGILGPNTGYYYGDIIIVFRHELMYHPDSNFAIQAATTFGQSQNAYKFRPWLKDPGSPAARIEHFHRNKLHCSIPGYEDAAAYELMALTGLKPKSLNDINLNTIKQRWKDIDSHCVFEAHLPQLIPLDYIDRIYIAETTFDSLSVSAQQSAKAIFANALCITPHSIDITIKPAGLHQPLDRSRIPYHSNVVNELFLMIENKSNSLPSIDGTTITLPPSLCKDHIIAPITISQSLRQYQSDKSSLADSSDRIYIYWQAFKGDMMITLTNEIINNQTKQTDLQCLTCYIAEWPSKLLMKNAKQLLPDYYEENSYISNHHPSMHDIFQHDNELKVSSTSFHRGCNTEDYITYNLIIDRRTSQVTLAIVGSNALYNHAQMTYTFTAEELNLNSLEYVQISARSQTVPVRNLVIRHQPMKQLHPTIDQEFLLNHRSLANTEQHHENDLSKMLKKLCKESRNCLLLYAGTEEGREHAVQYTHLCRFSEICYQRHNEPHLIHLPHIVPTCPDDQNCLKLGDPHHRAQFRHTNMPDYLVPCRNQQKCQLMKREAHRKKYFHGETLEFPSSELNILNKVIDKS